jgi:histidinol phosphatase-like PHP family hydrolase
VGKIVASVRAKGLDGIAITEHYNEKLGIEAKRIVSKYFDDVIMIIPGREIYWHGLHTVELFLSNDVTFRFLPHPVYLEPLEANFDFTRIHGIEIDNCSYDQYINKPRIKAIAEQHQLLLLSNSDAHSLDDIGCHYNEVSLGDLYYQIERKS